MNIASEADRELIRDLNGLYIGQLTPTELESLGRCIAEGSAIQDYSGLVGFFVGVGKVKFIGWEDND